MSRLILDAPECGCYRPPSSKKMMACYRSSTLPLGADGKAASAQLTRIRRDMVKARRLLMVDGQRKLSAFLVDYFDSRINKFCDIVMAQVRISVNLTRAARGWQAKDTQDLTAEITLNATEQIWRAALIEALGVAADNELVAAYTPIVQSIAARSHEATSTFLGQPLAPDRSNPILQRARQMASEVTRINDTTRKQLVDTLEQALADQLTVAEAVREIRATIPQIESARIPTIARTEIGNAIDAGTKQAITESSVVTFVEVIGCQAVEPGIPTFDGRPTCNIQRVPAHRVNELRFHPNHTGCIVPQAFIGDE